MTVPRPLILRWFNTAHTARAAMPGGNYYVRRLSHNALGGPDSMTVDVESNDPVALLGYLAYGVDAYDAQGQCLWWGRVQEVQIAYTDPRTQRRVWYGLTLDGMSNRTYITYNSGATTTTTAAANDTNSQNLYGRQEYKGQMSDITATTAAQRNNILLEEMKLPRAVPISVEDGGGRVNARIRCRGWYQTLGNRYYEKVGYGQNNVTAAGIDWYTRTDVGETAADAKPWRERLGCAITIAGSDNYVLSQLGFNIMTTGGSVDPDDGVLTYGIYTTAFPNQAGSVEVATGTATVWNAMTFIYVTLSPVVTLTAAAQYFITLKAPFGHFGAAGNPVLVTAHTDPRSTGCYWQDNENLATWALVSPACSLSYYLTGVQEHTAQIGDIVATSEFVTTCDIQNTSGVNDSVGRDGTQKALAIIEDLLKAGTTNNRRLLASVTSSRVLKIWEEPAASRSGALAMDANGFYDNQHAPHHGIPCGQWCYVRHLPIPTNSVPDPALFFIESAELDGQTGEWTVTPKGQDSPFVFGLES